MGAGQLLLARVLWQQRDPHAQGFPAAIYRRLSDRRGSSASDATSRGEACNATCAPPKNVILIVMESTTARYMSLYGSPYATTPRLEQEAAHALVFDNIYAHVGMTASSLVAITLSQYPGITFKQYTQERPDMPGTSLASVLKDRGYRTAFITSADIDFSGQDKFLASLAVSTTSGTGVNFPGPSSFPGDAPTA